MELFSSPSVMMVTSTLSCSEVWALSLDMAMPMVLAGKLSQIKNVHIIFAYAERLSFGRGYRLYFSKPSDKELKGDILERSQQINKYLEKLIKQCPQQYLWGYNRFKKP